MFTTVKKQMQEAFALLIKDQSVLFITDLDRDELWNTYLNGFEDPIEKQEHNCHCCRSFIKNYGNIVIIDKNHCISTIWDFIPHKQFAKSVGNLADLVLSSKVRDIFVAESATLGTSTSVQRYELVGLGIQQLMKIPITWNHFFLQIPGKFVNTRSESRESIMGIARDNKNVFKRSLDELTLDSIETVLELIAQNSLYKGNEYKGMLTEFLKHKKAYVKSANKDNYCWNYSQNAGAVAKIRNTAIGTLLIDLSEGKELDKSVEAFERVVAPTNYKRPKALVTKGMIEQAEKAISELGYADSLARRFAVAEDISINNLLFVNRDAKKATGVFEEMKEDVAINPKTLKKVEEIGIDDFIKNVLPTIKSVQLLFENQHLNNLVSLIAAKNNAPIMFKWSNDISWSYTNAVTDSIKEQVKAAGGKVEGELRVSLSWYNYDDLDLHVVEPSGNIIFFRNKVSAITGGNLDVDMNAGSGTTRKAVENIIWPSKARISEGNYKVIVNNFAKRETKDVGFTVEIEQGGNISHFVCTREVKDKENILTAEFNYTKKDGIKFVKEGNGSVISKEKWGISTSKFHKVSMIMNSPNYWGGETIGNKHTFFMLEGAKNDENARGLFNEFLKPELDKNRKVFEVLGGKLKVEAADKQLSGVGFSSTQRASVICKVEGKFERLLKVNF